MCRWSGWASAAGSLPRWRARHRPRIPIWCWSARWASSPDQAIVSYLDYPRAGFHDQAAFERVYGEADTDQLEQWDICREMVFRTAWKPYMYSQTLPHLLGGVRAKSLVVWGDDDRHVPGSAGEAYAKALPDARLETVAACGHYVDMEKPDELARLVTSFVNSN
jgi:pimeloyl-ACP methyl ester carboxylesterase